MFAANTCIVVYDVVFSVLFSSIPVCTIGVTSAFKFFPVNRELVYEYTGSVKVESQPPWVEPNAEPSAPSGWRVRGTLKVQRIDGESVAAAVSLILDSERG